MTAASRPRPHALVEVLYYLFALAFTLSLFNYYLTTAGGPTLLAFTLVPVTFVLFTLDALRKDDFYPRLPLPANYAIAAIYIAFCLTVSIYMYVEYQALGTSRAGIWNATDLTIGGLMFALVMEYARKRYFELFVLNILLILYAVYGWMVPGMFNHPGLGWTRILTSMSLEETTGVFSSLPQLALTLIGSFVLVLAVLRSFGVIDSILRGTSQIAARSPHLLPQTAVIGSFGVGAVSGSGAANAVTTGSATIPALIQAGMPRADAAAIEAASSLGGQLMPPIMGISAFLMADFLGVGYFDVVARGYAPAVIYFASVALGVYLLSVRYGALRGSIRVERMRLVDWTNVVAFLMVVAGLVLLMAVFRQPPIFAALYVFAGVASLMVASRLVQGWHEGGLTGLRAVGAPSLRFLDNFALMTAELTLLLATLGILTSAFVNTGVPTKVGFILVDAAGVNVAVMALVAFAFGALLGMGLPPAPTYILTALVIAPHMVKFGLDPWPVHFFAFFLAVWGELTPPTSVVAAVTSKIAEASFMRTLVRAVQICSSLFVLMAAMFVRPQLVLEPGLAQIGAMLLVFMASVGVTFSLQARFSRSRAVDWSQRLALMAVALVTLLHPSDTVALLGSIGIALFVAHWMLSRKRLAAAAALVSEPATSEGPSGQ